MSTAQPPHWKPWTFDDVVDVNYPAFALRTYLEQADVRAYLRRISAGRRIESACEIGCGYGRITVALGEFASRVVGFERQPEFVEEARRLHPNIEIRQVNSLGELPETDHAFDVVLTFTVLQHLTDAAAVRAIAEINSGVYVFDLPPLFGALREVGSGTPRGSTIFPTWSEFFAGKTFLSKLCGSRTHGKSWASTAGRSWRKCRRSCGIGRTRS